MIVHLHKGWLHVDPLQYVGRLIVSMVEARSPVGGVMRPMGRKSDLWGLVRPHRNPSESGTSTVYFNATWIGTWDALFFSSQSGNWVLKATSAESIWIFRLPDRKIPGGVVPGPLVDGCVIPHIVVTRPPVIETPPKRDDDAPTAWERILCEDPL